jgi:chemotaxis protein CheD
MVKAADRSEQSTDVIVGIADMKVSNNKSGKITTYSLGSCLAVAIYDPVACVGGLLHYLLHDSKIDRERAQSNPFYFADSGIPLLFRRVYKLGGVKDRIICKVAGASSVFDPGKLFDMGTLNLMAARDILSQNNVQIQGEYIGGLQGVTLTLNMVSGRIVATTQGGEVIEI